MKIAILGTRGIPANYGGFETFAEQLSVRMAARGHQVTVYCRSHHATHPSHFYRGVELVVLPTWQHKYFDTIVHTWLSVFHASTRPCEVILVCNAANALAAGFARLTGKRVILNVDGIERKRKKWNRFGRAYYQVSEWLATKLPNAIVTDARVIEAYYLKRYGKVSEMIAYGAEVERRADPEGLRRFGLVPEGYLLYVSRLEPENNAHMVIEAFKSVKTDKRLVIVGDAPYATAYKQSLRKTDDPRVLFLGFVFGEGYRTLQQNAYAYVHATEVGGTHPALIEAMGFGNAAVVYDTPENREVAGGFGLFYSSPEELSRQLQALIDQPGRLPDLRASGQESVNRRYGWDKITDQYERLFQRFAAH
ncbi:MAG: DUF1972 domain-containing protein [Acidobacteria bacterium]|nr:DUF1972 domain-containing protein [Acidobacteriota bacterium]